MQVDWKSLIPVAQHTVIIYFFLIMMLRLVGRRQLGQLTVLDIVIVILLGSAVETAMVNANTTLYAGIVCASTLLLLDRLVSRQMQRSRRLSHVVNHGPILLVHDGQFVEEHLRRVGLTKADVLEALRERETAGIENIKFAVMEADGEINVVPKDAITHNSKRKKPQGTPASPQLSQENAT